MNTPQKYAQKPVIVSSGTKYSKSQSKTMFITIRKTKLFVKIGRKAYGSRDEKARLPKQGDLVFWFYFKY